MLLLLAHHLATAQLAHGPLPSAHPDFPSAGWVSEFGTHQPKVDGGVLTIQGDSRAYLVQDYMAATWAQHKYLRLDLQRQTTALLRTMSPRLLWEYCTTLSPSCAE